MRTYKSKYSELVIAAEKHLAALEKCNRRIADLVSGEYRYVASVQGAYSDEQIVINQHRRSGEVLISHNGFANTFDDAGKAIEFWSTLSRQPHNLRVLAALERADGKIAA